MNRNTTERIEGKVEEIAGTIKKNIGHIIGSEQMEVDGKFRELEGQGRQKVAKASERLKGAGEEIVGSVKNQVGVLIDNQQMQLEGAARALEGKIRQKLNE